MLELLIKKVELLEAFNNIALMLETYAKIEPHVTYVKVLLHLREAVFLEVLV